MTEISTTRDERIAAFKSEVKNYLDYISCLDSVRSRYEIICLDFLAKRYTEPHRHYHGTSHILRLLELAKTMNILDFTMFENILWHDAYYIPTLLPGENERISSDIYESYTYPKSNEVVVKAIRATFCHWLSDNDKLPVESRLFLDLDLYDLGTEMFWVNNLKIEQETLPFTTKEAFQKGRQAFLKHLLEIPRIYRIMNFLEEPARRNIREFLGENYVE